MNLGRFKFWRWLKFHRGRFWGPIRWLRWVFWYRWKEPRFVKLHFGIAHGVGRCDNCGVGGFLHNGICSRCLEEWWRWGGRA